MITYTAKDIIKQARFISQTTTSKNTDFYVATNLLSNLYRDLYNDLILNGNAYIQNIETAETELPLEGFYKIALITDEAGIEIPRTNLRGNNKSGYYIENDILHMPVGTKHIKLCPMPATLTASDEFKVITLEEIPEDFTNPSVNEDGEIEGTEPLFWQGQTIDMTNLPSFLSKEDTTIVNVNVSDPYIYVSYSDNTIRLFLSEEDYVDVNPFNDLNRTFSGKVVAFSADDTTGKGMIIYDNVRNRYLYGSFVPNTELTYPDNTFFEVLIYRLAAILASLQGIANPYLVNNLLPNAESRFYQSLTKGSQGMRFNNVKRGAYR
jgi:hypothetical protein